MARKTANDSAISRAVTAEERRYLEAMANEAAGSDKARKLTRKRAESILAVLDGGNRFSLVPKELRSLARTYAPVFDKGGWKALIAVLPPRGGDFLVNNNNGYWAEQLTTACLNRSTKFRAIPYGTSLSNPFTGMQAFREHMEQEYLLRSWSAEGTWKRPDLLTITREHLQAEKGNDLWTPDLKLYNNQDCEPYVRHAGAAIEVETSLWQVEKATAAGKALSFTIKHEDLQALRNWISANKLPLFIIQVLFDCAYVLPFDTLEEEIRQGRVCAKKDRTTKKETYMIPLTKGVLLGRIPEPSVEGKIYTDDNGKVTVYGRLKETAIDVIDLATVEAIVAGTLRPMP